jgi:hypothetical protein
MFLSVFVSAFLLYPYCLNLPDSVAMTVTDHIASMIALISGVKSNHSTVRIKFKEVMQRDTGKYCAVSE